MLLDVHGDPLPRARIAGIGTKSHGGRSPLVEAAGHHGNGSTGLKACTGGVGQDAVLARDDDHPPVEVDSAHVHILQFRH